MHLKRILAPTDFSANSEVGLRQAAQLSKETNAELTLLHIHEIIEMAFMDFSYVEPPTQLQTACEDAEKRLWELAEKLLIPKERVQVSVITGSPTNDIIRLSKEYDLIVMPTHGRTGISHFLLGSVAERVVRAAQCSVLIVKQAPTTTAATDAAAAAATTAQT